MAVMIVKGNPACHFFAHNASLLLGRLLPVKSQGKDNENVAVGDSTGIDFINKDGKKNLAVYLASYVVHQDRNAFP
jgi:hypothetical protein